MTCPFTKGDLLKALEPYPDGCPVVVHNQPGLPFTYAVIGVMSAKDFDLTHLFDQSVEPPDEDLIYLLTEIKPGSS